MIVRFAEGHERGHCEKCRDVYDTRDDMHAGNGLCGRCWRAYFGHDGIAPVTLQPVPPETTTYHYVAADSKRAIMFDARRLEAERAARAARWRV